MEPTIVIPDEERTAFGLGYEYRRRGLPLDDNPFPIDSWKYEHFVDGWQAHAYYEKHPLKAKRRKPC